MIINLANIKGGVGKNAQESSQEAAPKSKVKFEVYGEEMAEKEVKASGYSGRIYLPPC